MTVGPYKGTYKKCGRIPRFALLPSTGETKSFYCQYLAMGTSLKIQIIGDLKVVSLCEVQVYGKGMYMTILHCN